MTSPRSSTRLTVRTITPEEHLDFIRKQRSASFLQTPAWGTVKSEWRPESLGWFDGDELVGAGLALYRKLPKLRRYLAYLPEGPVIDWGSDDLQAWLAPMQLHLARQGAFGIRMGPPVVTRRWTADDVKRGLADEGIDRLTQLPPRERSQVGATVLSQLRELGWTQQVSEQGFAAGQPQYNFAIPLTGRTEDDVLKGMNQQWRRNIKKAAKAGVEVTRVPGHAEETAGRPNPGSGLDPALEAALKDFHDLYRHTAERDGFTPRPLSYFQAMVGALNAEESDRIRLYLARHEGDLVAATLWIRVGGHTWYSYGASSTEKRDVRGSNAVQWAMIQDAIRAGADIYDLRGITDTLDADDPHVGLVRFKVGTGGEAVEYVGEWDLPVRSLLYRAFALYMKRRG